MDEPKVITLQPEIMTNAHKDSFRELKETLKWSFNHRYSIPPILVLGMIVAAFIIGYAIK